MRVMLQITIPASELWDEKNNEFICTKEQTLQLEHSLVSISKWESKWKKAFLKNVEKTNEEIVDYIKCMTITQNVDSDIYNYLTNENYKQINDYINDSMTATKVYDSDDKKGSRETITSELIYYWMIALNIPIKFEKWHLNRLLTLIRVCNVKNKPPKKKKGSTNTKETANRYAELNAARRKQLNSKG
jgi:hypothetical protein